MEWVSEGDVVDVGAPLGLDGVAVLLEQVVEVAEVEGDEQGQVGGVADVVCFEVLVVELGMRDDQGVTDRTEGVLEQGRDDELGPGGGKCVVEVAHGDAYLSDGVGLGNRCVWPEILISRPLWTRRSAMALAAAVL